MACWRGWYSSLTPPPQSPSPPLHAFSLPPLAQAHVQFLDAYMHSFESTSCIGAAIGAVVGLVCVTPACGYVHPGWSVVIGMVGTAFTFGASELSRRWKWMSDELDVFICHGAGGWAGTLLTGLFAEVRRAFYTCASTYSRSCHEFVISPHRDTHMHDMTGMNDITLTRRRALGASMACSTATRASLASSSSQP